MTEPEAAEEWVWLARIRRPQGRKGEVFAEILTDFPERFAERKRLWLLSGETEAGESSSMQRQAQAEAQAQAGAGAPGPSHLGTRETKPIDLQAYQVELTNHWPHKGGVVLHFAGVDSISDAAALNGLMVAIPRAERAELDADEVYIGELTGCTLVDVANAAETGRPPAEVGVIEDVDRTAGPVALLVVRGAAGEVLIPFAKSYLRRIDLEARRVEMALPEGLVDLNAPAR